MAFSMRIALPSSRVLPARACSSRRICVSLGTRRLCRRSAPPGSLCTVQAAAAAEVLAEETGVETPPEAASTSQAESAAPAAAPSPTGTFALNFLWLEKNIAIAVDQAFSKGQRSPVTEYFFWPRVDAWEELKTVLEAKDWIPERDRVILLNRATEVINFWQEEGANKHKLAEARAAFPDCVFLGK